MASGKAGVFDFMHESYIIKQRQEDFKNGAAAAPPVDEAAEKTISDYLRSWGLEAYIPKFLESIDVETLQMLSEADLKDLVPIIGHRAKLTTQIKLLTNIMSNAFENTCSNTTPDSNNQIMLYTVEDLPVVQTLPDEKWK
ncbi:uncharacterized protein LOC124640481 isoform X2 [Helicoverpa zea]|uniref:uncharacterized protein LOC124640481 isoform X2 n=1 Tax=Helicoverpa zea TaxID=7113 RepID=UPI001F5AB675|nr:uncharacterized protein LOC124640481 isoform X2 [Helicoverpa zea]